MKNTAQPIKRTDYRPSPFRTESIDLHFNLHPDRTIVTAESVFSRNSSPGVEAGEPLRLDGRGLKLLDYNVAEEVDGETEVERTDGALLLHNAPKRFRLRVVTEISPRANTALSGLYLSSGTYCTQCEAEGFRRITYAQDRPDILARYTTRIEGDRHDCPVLLANGNLVEQGELADNRHYAVWHDPFPKPSYLFALVAGDLACSEESYTTVSGAEVLLQIYVEQRNRKKCAHAMRSLKKAMCWDEEVYGREYDLERYMIVAVDDFNMGAMENKGLNIFNSKYILASPETATDQDYLGIEGVVAHEYFHNWTGNRVTCRDWFQLSLKEGLTVFRDQEFSADMNSRPVQRIKDVKVLRDNQFREDASAMAHPVRPDSYVEINNFYTVTVYNKGAEVVRMLRNLLGWERFRAGMDLYFQRHDGKAVTCSDFVAAMAAASGRDLRQFKLWYAQAGTPELAVEEIWREREGELELRITQHLPATPGQPRKEPFHIPVLVGFVGADKEADGESKEGKTVLLELQKKEQKFRFSGFSARPVLSFLRDFSAPVKVRNFQGRDALCHLMRADDNLFNRWNAAFTLVNEVVDDVLASYAAGETPAVDDRFITAFAETLAGDGDPALVAEQLTLPSEIYVAQRLEKIEPARIHAALQFVREQLARHCEQTLFSVYRRTSTGTSYSLDPREMGRRRLRACCLSYLLTPALADEERLALCLAQFEQADNMTDAVQALAVLSHIDSAAREKAFSSFYDNWKNDSLVVDKWLALQAISTAPGTLARVEGLLEHECFEWKNPNKVRALIGTFCSQNHYRFHDESGAGYRFLSRQVLALDPINPQVAARLMTPFVSLAKYSQRLRAMMAEQVLFIRNRKGISNDVFEIAEKCLVSNQ